MSINSHEKLGFLSLAKPSRLHGRPTETSVFDNCQIVEADGNSPSPSPAGSNRLGIRPYRGISPFKLERPRRRDRPTNADECAEGSWAILESGRHFQTIWATGFAIN